MALILAVAGACLQHAGPAAYRARRLGGAWPRRTDAAHAGVGSGTEVAITTGGPVGFERAHLRAATAAGAVEISVIADLTGFQLAVAAYRGDRVGVKVHRIEVVDPMGDRLLNGVGQFLGDALWSVAHGKVGQEAFGDILSPGIGFGVGRNDRPG